MRPDNMPPEHSEPARWVFKTLRSQALEIAREGHKGWGNTMTMAADEIERLRGDLQTTQVVLEDFGRRLYLILDRAEKAESELARARDQNQRIIAVAEPMRIELDELRAILRECDPIVTGHAESLHLFDGFSGRKPREYDALAERVRLVVEA